MGAMHMSRGDFMALTPTQWEHAARAWLDTRQADDRTQWERTRMLAMCTIQPHVTKRLKAEDVMRFDWDNEQRTRALTDAPQPTRAEALERLEAVARARGLTVNN